MTTDIAALLIFLKEIDRLKTIERKTPIHSGGRLENSAEHSWHLALAVLIFQDFAPKGIDLNKAIKMALLHDIVEIDAGDVFVYEEQPHKKANEVKALERITSLLPTHLAAEFTQIWNEFEDGKSIEAKHVHALDRFLPLYSNYLNDGYSWKKHQISANRIVAKNKPPIQAGIPELWEHAQKMVETVFGSAAS
jgi:putative hydrolases of HD superfamily